MGRGWIILISLVILAFVGIPAWAQTAGIEGTVHDSLGRAIPGAIIILKASDGREIAKSTADQSGHFDFPNVAAGTYALVASQKDFETSTAIVTADATRTSAIELVLGARTALDAAIVAKKLDEARNQLSPHTGSNAYEIGAPAIEDMPQGEDTSFNHVLLQTPGAAQDSYGQIHLRGEHANLQYRINDIILPEGITGFGQVLDTRIANNIELLDGALPAQYGYRTSGVVDITTKSGAFANGGVADIYGGSRGTIQPSLEYGGSQGNLNYFVSGNHLSNDLGIENPTSSARAIHDHTDQEKGFGYFSYSANPYNRLNLILGTSIGQFQLPDNPRQTTSFALAGTAAKPSSQLNENQREVNHYATVALQGTSEDGDFGYQIAPYARISELKFSPDTVGDLEYNGIASYVVRSDFAEGVQVDTSYFLNDQHTLRAGLSVQNEYAVSDNNSAVFPIIGGITQTTPITIIDNHNKTAQQYGIYLQDEWRLTKALTMNYGARFDQVNAYVNENQLSPRVGLVWRATDTTTFHAGYARYFTPPPLELVAPTSINKFANTTNASAITQDDPVRSERSNDFDAGVTQKITDELQLGWDNYYKRVHNLLDEGQFGAALVFTPFNYARGEIVGTEATLAYTGKIVSAFLNFAASRAMGEGVTSGQATFTSDPTELAYANHNFIHLDHDQLYTASGGVSYAVMKDLRLSLDGIFGSGLRSGFANTAHLPLYTQFDLGATYHLAAIDDKGLDLRFSVINFLNRSYELRNGTGIGVFSPQWGPRRAFFAGVSRAF